jgi:hypothetical protein
MHQTTRPRKRKHFNSKEEATFSLFFKCDSKLSDEQWLKISSFSKVGWSFQRIWAKRVCEVNQDFKNKVGYNQTSLNL